MNSRTDSGYRNFRINILLIIKKNAIKIKLIKIYAKKEKKRRQLNKTRYFISIFINSFLLLKVFNFILSSWISLWFILVSPGDLGSILGRVIPKTLKMVFDTSLLNTQQYKVRIKGKVK